MTSLWCKYLLLWCKYLLHKTRVPRRIFVADVVFELLLLITEIIQLYHLFHTPILYGLENDRQNAKISFQFQMAII